MHRIWWETLQNLFFFFWIRFSIMVWKSECRLWTKIILGHFQKKKTVENELSLKHYYSNIAWLTRHLLNFPPFLTSRRKGLLRYVSGFRLIFSSQIQKNILFCQTHFSHLLCSLIQCFLYFFYTQANYPCLLLVVFIKNLEVGVFVTLLFYWLLDIKV